MGPGKFTSHIPDQQSEADTSDTVCDLVDTQLDIPVTPALVDIESLFRQAHSLNCQQTMELVIQSMMTLGEAFEPFRIPFCTTPEIDVSRPQQFGNLLYIPKMEGTLTIVSDVEGHSKIGADLVKKCILDDHASGTSLRGQNLFVDLGDRINRRGDQATPYLNFLLDLKFRQGYLDRIHLLTGNHELSPGIQVKPELLGGGFLDEIARRFEDIGDPSSTAVTQTLAWHKDVFGDEPFDDVPQTSIALWRLYNAMFTKLPTMILTGNGLLLIHAGLTNKGPFSYLLDPQSNPRPSFREAISWISGQDEGCEDLVWSDFDGRVGTTAENTQRKAGLLFGSWALQEWLSMFHASVMIRGHQKTAPPGANQIGKHVWTAGENLITINSVSESERLVETNSGYEIHTSPHFQYLQVPLDRPITSVRDISLNSI